MKQILAPCPGEVSFNTKATPLRGADAGTRRNERGRGRKGARMSHTSTEKYEESKLYKIRHSAAHIMAQAVLEMFPDGKITIGPPVESGQCVAGKEARGVLVAINTRR